jgi:hypothetical protein
MLSKLSGVAAATAVGVSATIAGAQTAAVQWRVEDGGNGHWYRIVNQAGKGEISWETSRLAARSAGGELASFTSEAESAAFLALTEGQTRGNPWIGLFQDPSAPDFSEPAGGWRWSSGEPLAWTKWSPGEPNNSGGENWAVMWIDCCALGHWNDYRPTDPQGPDGYVIEWSADCNNDGIVDYGQILGGTFEDTNTNGVPDCCDAGIPCITDPCGASQLVVVDHFDGPTLDQGKWETFLPWSCSRAEQANGVVEFQARGHLRLAQEVPVTGDGVEIVVRFQYLSGGGDFFHTIILTDASPEPVWGFASNGVELTFSGFGSFNSPFFMGVPFGDNLVLGPPSASGGVPMSPGDHFEARMQIQPGVLRAELSNLDHPGTKFVLTRTWSGTPRGNRIIFSNRELCDSRTNLDFVSIRSSGEPLTDCDNDGTSDACQIANGAADSNHNGIPDTCECLGDLYVDGFVNGADLGALLAYWGPVTGTPASQAADIDRDGVVNGSDLGILLAGWGACGN